MSAADPHATARSAKRRKPNDRHHAQTTLDRFVFTPTPTPQRDAPDDLTPPAAISLPPSTAPPSHSPHPHSPSPPPPTSLSPTLLPPPPAPSSNDPKAKAEDKRSLRSRDDGPRLKSELATYFPNFEDIIFDAPRLVEPLTIDSTLYITDGNKSEAGLARSPQLAYRPRPSRPSLNGSPHPSPASPPAVHGSRSIDLASISKTIPESATDPLSDSFYFKAHRRAERREKQLRNIERERAMHEKVQLDRLLDGLQGHDWLRVLGITGITDGEARKYEAKRAFFIAEVQALVDKFKHWKEEEKRLKQERDEAVAAAAAADDDDDDDDDDEEEEDEDDEVADSEASSEPPSSDLNASAAWQLQHETTQALRKKKPLSRRPPSKHPPSSSAAAPLAFRLAAAPPPDPITSFYAKRHLRDAALAHHPLPPLPTSPTSPSTSTSHPASGPAVPVKSKSLTLRSTRHSSSAFGQPVPDLPERDFELPDEYISQDALRASARARRRRKRESRE